MAEAMGCGPTTGNGWSSNVCFRPVRMTGLWVLWILAIRLSTSARHRGFAGLTG